MSYGTRANETGIRNLVQNVATLAAVTVSPSDPNASGLERGARPAADRQFSAPGVQTISDIETQLAGAQISMSSMKAQHQQTSATLTDMLQRITGVSNEQVGSELLTLQTHMQASMQTTAHALPDQPGELHKIVTAGNMQRSRGRRRACAAVSRGRAGRRRVRG